MSQFNDAPERDDNEIGNDSASEVAGSVRNLSNTAHRYNEGQKAQNNSGSSEDKSDNNGDSDNKSDSNNSEKPNSSDNKDAPNESGNSNNTVEDNPTSSDFSNNFSNNSPDNSNGGNNKTAPNNKNNKNGQTPTNSQDPSQDPNNPDGENNQPENNQQNNTPQNNNAGNGPKVSSGPKPGDVAGESGGGVNTNAGTVKPPSSAESGSQAASQGAQAAQQGAEAAKQAGEVAQAAAEGAAEGSVVPGAGTVAVAAARTAWALRHTIAKLVMVIILVIAILSSAIESLPGIIWNQAFDEDGKEIETSIEAVYGDLVATVQDFVNDAYTEAVIEATEKYNKGNKIKIDGEEVNLNELNTPILGDGIGDETIDKDGNPHYKYAIGSDICEIIAHFTVKCKLENEEPTKENLLKYFEKGRDELFKVETTNKFKKDGVKKKLKKLVYVEYVQVPQYKLDVLESKELALTTAALEGAWWETKNQDFIYYLVDYPGISVEEYNTLCDNYNTVSSAFFEHSSPDGSVSFPVAGDISKIYYSNFTA
ncbi:MAG: hypothetical protein UGF89_05205, partial [Acutalibacteraceae bacterium]|nr:hypothetical protein [Acutalibacteraceae bacterium]